MWFKPQVVEMKDGRFCVKKLGLFGWKYLDLHNYKTWRYGRKHTSAFLWNRSAGSRERAQMALTFNTCPPPF